MRRKMGAPKPAPIKVRAPRKATVPYEKYAALPNAIVDGKFLAEPKARVYAWRERTGEKPSWHTCTVVRVSPDYVELMDDTLGQWFCFNPAAPVVPNVRMEALPKAQEKPEAAGTVATTAEEAKKDA